MTMQKQKKKNQESQNYIDYIPSIRPGLQHGTDEAGNVTVYMENKGIFNFLAQKLFGKPKVSQIHLDEFGNFIWSLIDGEKSIYVIGIAVKEKFGSKAEPLYERLTQYLRTMESYGFIVVQQNTPKE